VTNRPLRPGRRGEGKKGRRGEGEKGQWDNGTMEEEKWKRESIKNLY
jgi:hypothetical protein